MVLTILAIGFLTSAAAQSVFITEFMAANTGTLLDDDRESSDWIELYNAETNEVSVAGWYLSDNSANLVKWRFPSPTTLGPQAFLVVFASGKNRTSPPLHTNFKLDQAGEYLALVRPDGTTVAHRYLAVPPQLFNVSFGLLMAGSTVSSNPPTFLRPTPGGANLSLNAGLDVSDLAHHPLVPREDQALGIIARISSSTSAVRQVTLRVRVMFLPETAWPMSDDGAHDDGGAGDGIFGAILPPGTATNGQMIRYAVLASDEFGNTTRWPPFLDPVDSPEYAGTVVQSANSISTLPVVHLFVHPNQQAAIDSQAGGRASLFHDGEFYDNIDLSVRGNSTAGYVKKSHRVEFHRDHLFRHPGATRRIRQTSFLAEYADPSYLRQNLSLWLMDTLGVPAPFHYPVRLQLNGAFYQLAFHSDVQEEEMLERLGYDPNGALYANVGIVTPTQFSTGGFQKQTRKGEGNADYTALAVALLETNAPASRFANFFDLMDVPNVINYLGAARFVHEDADVWSDMALYHDNDGDGLWRIIPYDMNLTWGAVFYEGNNPLVIEGVQATNDINKAHPLYGAAATPALNSGSFNRVYDTAFLSPALREMFLRRLRTLLDTSALPADEWSPIGQRIVQTRDLIATEATIDRLKWGWPAKGGVCNFNPGITPATGANALITQFLAQRRQHLLGKHSVTNTALPIGITKAHNAGIPAAQPPDAVVSIAAFEFSPSSGNQAEEYVCLTNSNPYAVDLSGWQLTGGIEFRFRPGTVIVSNGLLFVSPDLRAFRARAAGPRGGQGLFVVGPYSGQLSARGEAVQVVNQAGRTVADKAYVGAPSAPQQFLRITEIMYHPPPGPTATPDSPNDPEAFEFIELKNIGPVPLDLGRVQFTDGIAFAFTNPDPILLGSGQAGVLVRNREAFIRRYGTNSLVLGEYTGLLDNGGEQLRLLDPVGDEILTFTYDPHWYPLTDGPGFSLVIVDETAPPEAWNRCEGWRPSGQELGTPGAPDPGPLSSPTASVVINELLSNPEPPYEDAVELHNTGTINADVSFWYLTDEFTQPRKFQLSQGSVIAPNDYVAFDEHAFNPFLNPPSPRSFSFRSDGDAVFLFSADGTGRLTGSWHGFKFGPAETNVAFGRHLTSSGQEHFVRQTRLSFGEPNPGPKVGPIVISEIQYHPPDIPVGGRLQDNALHEFIELRNITDRPVTLSDPSNALSTWRLSGSVTYQFAPRRTIPAHGHLVIVPFDPRTDLNARDSFQSVYGANTNLVLAGPYAGHLPNSGGEIELSQPLPGALPTVDPVTWPCSLVDRVRYTDAAPWPLAAGGVGPSLQRLDDHAYADDPINWRAATPSPGEISGAQTPPAFVTQPQDQTSRAGSTVVFRALASGDPPLRYQWQHDGDNFPGANSNVLSLVAVRPSQSGSYSVTVYNQAGATISRSAVLQILPARTLSSKPESRTLRGSTNEVDYGFTTNNVTFVVAVTDELPARYQWRFNGVELAGATSPTLTLDGVGLAHDGFYDVVVSDDFGDIITPPARLTVLLAPTFLLVPLPQTVPSNGQFTATTVIRGNPPPFRFEWREVSTVQKSLTTTGTASVFTFGPITNSSPRQWRLVVFNEANSVIGSLAAFNVTALPDTDQDGIPDGWETQFGLKATNASDRTLDQDGDGASNYQEYIAGTDPLDPSSYLRIEPPELGRSTRTLQLQFFALSNKTYAVEVQEPPSVPAWSTFADVLARPTNRIVTLTDPLASNAPTHRMYRLVTPLSPR